ncbi:MAG: glutamine--fructose-6-phosphate transaminase (isomerizing) [Negativicutes bacterium]|jgi:glucosamine--fructose-6-phosphate aminotransferase (isomerizing)
MCGIIGYIGKKNAAPILLEGLTKLEYRGYDSAGIAVMSDNALNISKSVGRLNALQAKLAKDMPKGKIGIGHSRWATHGRPSDENSHPHADCSGKFVVVHNGIIENYLVLKEQLIREGHKFESETDTEVVPHLVEKYYQGDFRAAVVAAIGQLEGSYALVFMSANDPDKLFCIKKDNPMVIGLGKHENFVASDIPAIINHTKRTYIMNDGELAEITAEAVKITDLAGKLITKKVFEVTWSAEAAEKGGYEHFMLKEIYEQPKAIRETLRGRINADGSGVNFDELKWTPEYFAKFDKIVITACGTAYYAGVVGKYYLEQLVRIPVEIDLASEYRYRNPMVNERTLTIIVSQSGETSDTLAALRESKRLGSKTLAITNVLSSTAAREADSVIYTWAGPEIAVASTKAYTTQLVTLCMFALYCAGLKNDRNQVVIEEIIAGLRNLPALLHETLDNVEPIKNFAALYANARDLFFLGRLLDYAVALEGALKLKEISYIHAEAYAAGELKHGTLALIEDGVPVFALATQSAVFGKMMGNIKEVKARGAKVIGIALQSNTEIDKYVDHKITIPDCTEYLAPILAVIPLQLYAYYSAIARGCDVDKPRNLAKSVTVE